VKFSAAIAVGALLVACASDEIAAPTDAAPPTGAVAATSVAATSGPPPQPTSATPTTTATTPKPSVVTKLVNEIRTIPFGRSTVEDPSLEKGSRVLITRGVNGQKRLTYRVTMVNGVRVSKKLVSATTLVRPVDQVIAVGTKVEVAPVDACDPNYAGACVPIASDVDCAGGSGNGPEYVSGPVEVVGTDVYDLDRDNDGVGCEN